jgi:hypothetical protein
MTDKKKTMRELLEEVKLNEQQASSAQQNQENQRPIRTYMRKMLGIKEPTTPEDKIKDEQEGAEHYRNLAEKAPTEDNGDCGFLYGFDIYK